jgi:hypothetical protein
MVYPESHSDSRHKQKTKKQKKKGRGTMKKRRKEEKEIHSLRHQTQTFGRALILLTAADLESRSLSSFKQAETAT